MLSHLALIMDGNRRWAKSHSLLPWLGHKQGSKVVEMVMKYCLDNNISYLSLYTFSLENFARPEKEVSYLFSLISESLQQVKKFVEEGIRIKFVGDISRAPVQTQIDCQEIEQATKDCSRLQCNILFCYGGRQEIASACEGLRKKAQAITTDAINKSLWTGGIPDPDAVIRTGGVKRLSNFLLYQASYSEIRFLDCLWPDLTEELLHETVLDCVHAQKNSGK